jgi:hypothetical protein
VAFLVAQVIPTFDTAAALRRITQRPVLGSVSRLTDASTMAQAKRRSMAFSGALGGLIVIYGAWLAWLSMLSRA